MKTCARCNQTKANAKFAKTRFNRDGLAMICNECGDKAIARLLRDRDSILASTLIRRQQ